MPTTIQGKQEYQRYMYLQEKVVAEQTKFMEFAKKVCSKRLSEFNNVDPEIGVYVFNMVEPEICMNI